MKNPLSAYRNKIRARRDEWRPVLESEVKKWSALSYEQIISRVPERNECYETDFNGKKYQVEVEILENTGDYLHLSISVDDGSLPASLSPAAGSFLCHKATSGRLKP